MTEKWKPVLGYEECYSISDSGRLARTAGYGKAKTPCWKIRAPAFKKGYRYYHMCKDGIRKYRPAHVMVWESFNGSAPDGKELNHIDCDRSNSALSNLELMTRSENAAYAFSANGRAAPNNPSPGSKNGSAKLTEADIPTIRQLLRDGKYQYEVAEMYGVSQPAIGFIARGKTWRHA